MQVARDRGDDGVDAVELEELPAIRRCPCGRFCPLSATIFSPRSRCAGSMSHTARTSTPGICSRFWSRTDPRLPTPMIPMPSVSLGPTLARCVTGNNLPGHRRSGRAQELSTTYACHGRVLPCLVIRQPARPLRL